MTFTLFFLNATATPDIYTLSLHDALPISDRLHLDPDRTGAVGRDHRRLLLRPQPDADRLGRLSVRAGPGLGYLRSQIGRAAIDRKSTRLNSSHSQISYAVFCLKKKNKQNK